MGRFVRPEEVASAVAWLCEPAQAAVTGRTLTVAGAEVV
jgi:NAD(P)-dependent dehydrogenase (short-subunit alcohol dehydrogenase family)